MPIDDPLVTDEDLALRAGADFALLLDPDGLYASGSDGSFAGFDLLSPSNDFADQGVPIGSAVLWTRADGDEAAWFVDSVAPAALTVRRKGQAAGSGVPPGREAGADPVEFRVLSLDAQARRASAGLRRRLGIDPDAPDPADPVRPEALAEACVLTVLADRYLAAAARMGDQEDAFARKAEYYRGLLAALLAGLDALYAGSSGVAAASGPYGTVSGRIRTGTDRDGDTGIRAGWPPGRRGRSSR